MKPRKPQKSGAPGKTPSPPTRERNFIPGVIAGLAVAGLAGFLIWQNQNRSATVASQGAAPEPAAAPNTGTATTPGAANLAKLKGKWQRTDGDYVIEIQQVEDNGKLRVAYLNPAPIHVAKAEATQSAGATKVFVELQDVNYPGCTYTLVYLPERDQLAGVYYQALQQQSYEVYFERMK